jgi:hypothetical protein
MSDERGHVSFMFKDANNSFLFDRLAAAIFRFGGFVCNSAGEFRRVR